MLNYLQNEYAEYLLKDNIIRITYKENVTIDIEAALQIVKDRVLLHKGQQLPVLCDARSVNYVTKPARDYLAIEGSILISAVAFVTEPSVIDLFIKMYLRASRPPVKTKIFYEITDALQFLEQVLI